MLPKFAAKTFGYNLRPKFATAVAAPATLALGGWPVQVLVQIWDRVEVLGLLLVVGGNWQVVVSVLAVVAVVRSGMDRRLLVVGLLALVALVGVVRSGSDRLLNVCLLALVAVLRSSLSLLLLP